MLESLAEGLAAHRGAPDKEPARRLATLEAAGELAIPFTTGILVGIGDDRADQLAALRAIAASHARHGHVQEVIVQNFLPKPGTAMAKAAPCPAEDLQWAIAAARLVLPPEVHVQAPPNLSDDLGAAARRRHRRLGRRVAGDGRPREPRAGLAGARRPARGDRGGRPHAGAPADRLPDVRPRPRRAGSTRPCASPCSTRPTPRAWPATPRGARGARSRRPRCSTSPAPHGAPRPRLGRWRRGRGPGRRGARPGGGRGGDRDALQRPRPRGAHGGRGGRRPAPPGRRRRRDLRAQPQHQLHERLHVQVPLLRLLQGPALAQPARRARTCSSSTRSPGASSRPRPRAPPRSACRAASTRTSTGTTTCTCSRRCGRARPTSTSTASPRWR